MPTPHYLYEQAEGGKELFVYYCSKCNCTIEVRHALGLTTSFDGLCKSCSRPLEGGAERALFPAPANWSDAITDHVKPAKPKPLFQSASSIPHFSLGFSRLDVLLRPLSEGHFVVFSGGPSSIVAELATFRAQLPVETGGLDSAVIFIDGGNHSDPYALSSFAKQKGLRPAAAMRRVASCRVFTIYQLASLVSEHLERAVEDYATRLVVISDVLGTFNEPELDEREARRVLGAVKDGIEKVKRRALVVATLVSPNRYDSTIVPWADTLVRLSSQGERVRAELLRHKNRALGIADFRLSQLPRVATVEAPR